MEEPEKLTELGRKLTQYPVLPRLGVMLVKALQLGVLVPVVAVVAALSVQVRFVLVIYVLLCLDCSGAAGLMM